MMEFLSTHFAPGPLFGWLCVISLILIPLPWIRHFRSRHQPTVRFSRVSVLKQIPASWAVRGQFIVPFMRTLAIIALIFAMARPQAGGEYRDASEGIAIQMVLDISGSMQEDDFVMGQRRTRRIDAVKQVFEDFVLGSGSVQGRENDLIGMTTFAMYADTRVPLTRDHGSLVDLLRETDIPGWVNGRMVRELLEANYTSLGDAIVLATDDLRRAGEQAVAGVPGVEAAKSRIMILLTDGANNPPEKYRNVAPDPLEAAKVAAKLGIKIYTIGAVGSGSGSQVGFFSFRGVQVDEATLKGIAQATDGRYFRATDAQSLRTIYDEIDQLERSDTGERIYQDDVYAAKISMLVALGLLMAEIVLINTRFRRLP